MFRFITTYITMLFLSVIIYSCGNNTQNPVINQDLQTNTFGVKIEGLWKLYDPSGNPYKTADYYFYSNNLCNVFTGTSDRDIENSFCKYKVYINNGITMVLIKDRQNRQTVFKVNSINDSKMLVVFEVKYDKNLKDKKEVELIKYNP